MPSQDKRSRDSIFRPENDIETPFLDEDLFVKEAEPELEAHLESLIGENPFTRAFEENSRKVSEPEIYEEYTDWETEEPEIESFYEHEAEPQEEEFGAWEGALEQPYTEELETIEEDGIFRGPGEAEDTDNEPRWELETHEGLGKNFKYLSLLHQESRNLTIPGQPLGFEAYLVRLSEGQSFGLLLLPKGSRESSSLNEGFFIKKAEYEGEEQSETGEGQFLESEPSESVEPSENPLRMRAGGVPKDYHKPEREQSSALEKYLGEDPTQTKQQQPGIAPTQMAVFNPDANEAAARAANPNLPRIDRTQQTLSENNAAAQQLVLVAFGGEVGVNKAFDNLPNIVKEKVDGKSTSVQGKTANRIQFLARARLYLNSWQEVLDHFGAIERLTDGKVDLFLHKDAKVRLERALNVLKSKGQKLPEITGGFSLRPAYHSTAKIHSPGMMTHFMGYAFDALARTNPRVTSSEEPAGLVEMLAVTIGRAARMDLGPKNEEFTIAMGKRTAGNTVAATDDTDPNTVTYFKRFKEQFNQMVKGSQDFRKSISDPNRKKLLEIRNEYFDELRAINKERAKGSMGDVKVIDEHEAKRRTLLQSMPPLMKEWIISIDKAINKVFTDHPEMSKMRSPVEIRRSLKDNEAKVKQVKLNEAQARAAKVRALAQRDEASKAVDSAIKAKRRAPPGDAFLRAEEALKAARQRLSEKMDALIDALGKESNIRLELKAYITARDALMAELKDSDKPKLPWLWLDNLRKLRQNLVAPDLSTPAGLRAYERLTTGNLNEIRAYSNPPLLRMLDVGFFNPTNEFNLAFFEEVAHSGFLAGASWSLGWVDSMHFELLEGRHSLISKHKSP